MKPLWNLGKDDVSFKFRLQRNWWNRMPLPVYIQGDSSDRERDTDFLINISFLGKSQR